MRKFLLFCLVCISTLTSAQTAYKVEDIPMVHLQDARRYVSNPDGVLLPETVAAIDTALYALEQQTSIQTLVVAVNQIEGGDCFDFALKLGQSNGVGKKEEDNGLVVLLVTGERCIQFVTGYGLEGTLPDAACKQIQVRYMNPYFKAGDWDAGMIAGVKAICQQLNGTGSPLEPESEDDGLLFLLGIFFCCFLIVPLLVWINIRQRSRCPKCHKYALKQVAVETIQRTSSYRTEEVTYVCSNCGNIVKRQRRIYDREDINHRGGNGGPFMGGTFFGGSRGGGGFGGGSFGGGSFGGGGAGSRF